jgi:cell division protein FtsQ
MRDVKPGTGKQRLLNKREPRNVRKVPRWDWKKLSARILRWFLIASCTLLLAGGALLLVKIIVGSDHFTVQTIDVRGNKRLASQDVIELSDIRQGVSTFDLNLEIIGQKLAENDWISSAHIMRKLPQGIVIDISEREAVFIINLDYLYYVDNAGEIFKVLRGGDTLDYPLATGLERQQLLDDPQQATERLQYIAQMITDWQRSKFFNTKWIAQIDIEPKGGYTLYTDPLGVPIRVGSSDFSAKIDRLEQIFSEIKQRLPQLEYIDLTVPDEVIVKTTSRDERID